MGGGGATGKVGQLLKSGMQMGPRLQALAAGGGGAAAYPTAVGGQTAQDNAIDPQALGNPADVKRVQQMLKQRGLYTGTVDGNAGGATGDAIAQWNAKVGSAKANDPVALQREQLAAQQKTAEQVRLDKLAAEERARAEKEKAAQFKWEATQKANDVAKTDRDRFATLPWEQQLWEVGKGVAPYVGGLGFAGAVRKGIAAKRAGEAARNAETLEGAGENARMALSNIAQNAVPTTPRKGMRSNSKAFERAENRRTAALEDAKGQAAGASDALYSTRGLDPRVHSPKALYEHGPGRDLLMDVPAIATAGAGAVGSHGMANHKRAEADAAMALYEKTKDERYLNRSRQLEREAENYTIAGQAETAAAGGLATTSKLSPSDPVPKGSKAGKDLVF